MDAIALAIKTVFPAFSGNIHAGLRLGEITGWDSMNSVNLALELESHFGVDLSDVILTPQQTVIDVASIIESRGATV
jgi:acyl carrier protein